MAWTAATANYTGKKNLRNALQSDTIGEVFTKSFEFSCGASANTDSIELTGCKIPANTHILNMLMVGTTTSTGALAACPANSGLAFKFTTGTQEFANAANNVKAVWTPTTLVAANSTSTVDDTITVTQVGAANAVGAMTIKVTLQCMGVGGTDATYSTFTK